MDNYELEEKNFRKLLKRIVLFGLTGVILVGSYEYLTKKDEPKNIGSNKPSTKLEEITKYQSNDGVIYMAPEGFHLEEVNGQIYAVREVRDVIDAYKNVVYKAPFGYTLEGRKATRTYYNKLELTPVDTEKGKVYMAPAGYTLENIGGKVYAVRTMTETIDVPATVTYTAPAGYTLVGSKAVRVVKEYTEPLIMYEDHTTFGR